MSYEAEVRREEDMLLTEQVRRGVIRAIKMQRYEPGPKDSLGCVIGYRRAVKDLAKLVRKLPL